MTKRNDAVISDGAGWHHVQSADGTMRRSFRDVREARSLDALLAMTDPKHAPNQPTHPAQVQPTSGEKQQGKGTK